VQRGGRPGGTHGTTSGSDFMGMLKLRTATIAAAGFLAMGLTAPASAGLIGGTVTSQYYAYGAKSGAATVFTADGLAHARTFNTFDVIVTSTQIIYDFRTSGTWSASGASLNKDGLSIRSGNLLTFEGLPRITGVTIDAATNMAGLTAANVTFNDGAVAIDWVGRAYTANTLVVLNVATAAPAAVSEPPALAMAGLAAFGLAATAIRRRGARIA